MPESKPQLGTPHRRAITEPYDINYFAGKHDICRKHARELICRIGNDRQKLNAAALKLFRK